MFGQLCGRERAGARDMRASSQTQVLMGKIKSVTFLVVAFMRAPICLADQRTN